MPRTGAFEGMSEKCIYTVKLYHNDIVGATVDGKAAEISAGDGWCNTGIGKTVSVTVEVKDSPVTIEFKA